MQTTLQNNLTKAAGFEPYDADVLDGPPGASTSSNWLQTLLLVWPLWRYFVVLGMFLTVSGMYTTFSNDCSQVRKDLGRVRQRSAEARIEQNRLELEYGMRIGMSKLEHAGLERSLVEAEEVWMGAAHE